MISENDSSMSQESEQGKLQEIVLLLNRVLDVRWVNLAINDGQPRRDKVFNYYSGQHSATELITKASGLALRIRLGTFLEFPLWPVGIAGHNYRTLIAINVGSISVYVPCVENGPSGRPQLLIWHHYVITPEGEEGNG